MPQKHRRKAGSAGMSRDEFLIPVKKFTRRAGVFRWPARAVLASARTADVLPLAQLAGDLRDGGLTARVQQNAVGPAAVRVRRNKAVAADQAYRLAVSAAGVEIVARGDAGAYYAVQTLREMVAVCGPTVPACVIEDGPDFRRRGIYHDCSRGKVPKPATLKGLVEQLGRWKINELQLYIENVFTFAGHPEIGKGYSPFTPGELLELQEHCKRHHVRLVGSLASLGHMEKILRLPAYRHLAEMADHAGRHGGTTLCATDPGSIRLVAELYEEFLPLFEAEDFNICGDEPWELGRGRSKRQADRVGVGRVYLAFLLKLHRLCERHGKRMNLWGDIVLLHPDIIGELPADVVVLNWDYHPCGKRIPRTHELADAGLALMVCPGTNAWGSHGCRLKMGMENIAVFAAEGLKRVAEGLLNTDWGDGGHRQPLAVSLHNFAFGAAAAWNAGATRPRGFTRRFALHTFGSGDGRFVEAIRTLGAAHEALGLPYGNGTILYYQHLTPTADLVQNEALRQVGAARFKAHRDALAALRWPKPPRTMARFLAESLKEYALAARLDRVSCGRLLAAEKIRAGAKPTAAEVKSLVEEMQEAMREHKRLWTLRNKPSRLRDVMALYRARLREYRKLRKT